MKYVRLAACLTALLLDPFGHSLLAQSMISVKSGSVSYTEGKAYIDDQPVEVEVSPTHFYDVKDNAVVRTEAGRAEVLLGPCAVMWMGDNTSFRMITSRLIDTRIELLTGSAVVRTGGMSNVNQLTLMVKEADVVVGRKGLFRLDMGLPPVPPTVKVLAGKADVERATQEILLGTGRIIAFDGAAQVHRLDKAKPDALDDWSKRRAAALIAASDLAGQQARRDQCVDSAAGQAANHVDVAPGLSLDGRTPYDLVRR